jgi:hypothetical protein
MHSLIVLKSKFSPFSNAGEKNKLTRKMTAEFTCDELHVCRTETKTGVHRSTEIQELWLPHGCCPTGFRWIARDANG